MTQELKLRRKDLKGPDEFQTATHRALGFLRDHEREIAIGAVAVAAVVAIALGVHGYRSWRDGQASAAFREAFRTYVGDDASAAHVGFQRVADGWPGSRWAQLSSIYRGDLAMESGDRQAAKESFETVLEWSNEPALRQIAEYNLGVLKRNAGEDGATDHLSRAAAIDGPLRAAAVVALAGAGRAAMETVDRSSVEDLEPVLPTELREFVGDHLSED